MKVGDYVRFNFFRISVPIHISKIIDINYDEQEHINLYVTEDGLILTDSNIIKSSPNIIDLFEEHDLVVIEYYSLRYNERVTRLFEVTFKDSEYINLSNAKCEFMLVNGEFNKGDKELKPIIKSIVTKEQFEAMKYEIK